MLLVFLTAATLYAQEQPLAQEAPEPQPGPQSHRDHAMVMDETGMVMNANSARLPRDCKEISADYEFTIEAGTAFAADVVGTTFGYSLREIQVEPCSRIKITLVNKDETRHQWMVHGLPKYLYPAGMFHLEAAGGHSRTDSFIVPSDNQTYLVHCDLAQHMEKGMKAQLRVGRGGQNFWSIPTLSASFNRSDYLPHWHIWMVWILLIVAGVATLLFIRSGHSS